MSNKSRSSSQDRISDLERQLIALQRELDEARRQSVSMWCKIRDFCTGINLPDELSLEVTNGVSNIINDWVRDQRSKMNNRYSILSTMPPYTDCLNDIVVSITNPATTPELPPYSHEGDEELREFSEMPSMMAQGSRIPPPPLSSLGAPDDVTSVTPKMMRVNVPKGGRVAVPAQQ